VVDTLDGIVPGVGMGSCGSAVHGGHSVIA
jgi:hypothetical protein